MSRQLLAIVFLAMLAVGLLFGVARPAIEADIAECQASGGEQTAHGELLYCEYDNGTGHPLGSDGPPQQLAEDPPEPGPRGLAPLIPVVVLIAVVVVLVGVIQRFRQPTPE